MQFVRADWLAFWPCLSPNVATGSCLTQSGLLYKYSAQLICQDVQGFITFSQQKDFNGAINDLLSWYKGNKQIDPPYDLM